MFLKILSEIRLETVDSLRCNIVRITGTMLAKFLEGNDSFPNDVLGKCSL